MLDESRVILRLLLCLGLAAALAALLAPSFIRARTPCAYSACDSNLKNVATALQM